MSNRFKYSKLEFTEYVIFFIKGYLMNHMLFCCRAFRGEDKVCGEIPARNPTVQKLQRSPGGSSVFTGMGSGL